MAAKAFGVSSFTSVGHLLHINLKEQLLPHKHQIGQAILAKNLKALAVVNKVNNIDNEYRNFEIEIIAKRDDCKKTDEELMIVEVNENKCRFQMDFSKVYWNSRLSTEHERIINKLNKYTDIVFDLFAGVGPFSIPAAKAKCKTYANDLNPESVKWLEINKKRNKVITDMLEIYNMDAKDFILDTMKTKLKKEYERVRDEELATKPVIHIIMNLPAIAPTFLPHFVGLFKNESRELANLFTEQSLQHIVHCYCFLKGAYEDPKLQVKSIIEEELGKELTDDILVDIFRVRNVAPFKDMFRIDFKLDSSILFDPKSEIVGIMKNNRTPISKKQVTINEPVSRQNGSLKRPRRDDSVDSYSPKENGTNHHNNNNNNVIQAKKARFDSCNIL